MAEYVYYTISTVLAAMSEVLLVLLLILLAKGWTIVRRKITASGRTKIGVYITLYICVYLASIIWSILTINAPSVNYFFSSPPGIMLLVLRLYGWLWFTYSVYTSIKTFHSKKVNYIYMYYSLLFSLILSY